MLKIIGVSEKTKFIFLDCFHSMKRGLNNSIDCIPDFMKINDIPCTFHCAVSFPQEGIKIIQHLELKRQLRAFISDLLTIYFCQQTLRMI